MLYKITIMYDPHNPLNPQGAKSELKNLAVVDVHQIRLTNFYFA